MRQRAAIAFDDSHRPVATTNFDYPADEPEDSDADVQRLKAEIIVALLLRQV